MIEYTTEQGKIFVHAIRSVRDDVINRSDEATKKKGKC